MFQSVETGHTRPRGERGPGSLSGNRKFSQHKDGVSGGRMASQESEEINLFNHRRSLKALLGPCFQTLRSHGAGK